jgi:mannosyl-3-phosphoglycerate phosphatase family protein
MTTRPGLVVVSDLDGTLLDANTYALGPAEAVVHDLRRAGVPLVICSSKTRVEIESLMARLGLDEAFISENGGALHLPKHWPVGPGCADVDGGRRKIELGRPYSEVVRTLRETTAALGVEIRGFADMTVGDISDECGLTPLQAQLAKLREYDEPFRIVGGDPQMTRAVIRALHGRGVRTLEGGRYLHAVAGTDKGRAVALLRNLLTTTGSTIFIGLGDAPNDVDLLKAVDVPVIVRGAGDASLRLQRTLPTAQLTDEAGPAGWAVAVGGMLRRWHDGQPLMRQGW